jgi:benzoyl-CoA 2,3-dioxygenase component B
MLDEDGWQAAVPGWLPSADDRAYVESLMHGAFAPGQMAGWLAPPSSGVHGKPVAYEYVVLG